MWINNDEPRRVTKAKPGIFDKLDELNNYGLLLNIASYGSESYRVLRHATEREHHTVQNGTVIFQGTWGEVEAFVDGMLYSFSG